MADVGGSAGPAATRNLARTRERLLAAAYEAFGTRGYVGTGIRDVARAAGVTSALVVRYFGGKAVLYEEALVHAMYGHGFFTRDRASFGARMAEFVGGEDDRVTRMVVLALADPQASAIARKVAERHILGPLAEWLGGPNARPRAEQLYALFVGHCVVMRQIAPGDAPATARWLAESIQAIVDDERP